MERRFLASSSLLVLLLSACQSSPAPEPQAGAPESPAAMVRAEDEGPAPLPEPPARAASEGIDEAERLLAQEVARARIEAQRRDVVARYFLEEGRTAYREGRLDAARAHLHRVLELEPSGEIVEAARTLLREVEGGGLGTRGVFDHVVERANVQVQQAYAQAHVLLEEGRELMVRRDFEAAFDRFERAEEILRWMPYDSARGPLADRAEALRDARAYQEAEWEEASARALREEARRMAEGDETR